jgi:capsular polysaccharide biosynthesis protein
VVFCHEIVIPTIIQTANTFFPNRAFCTGLHDAIVEASGARKRPARTRHIYLSRMNQINYSNRSIDNEDAVRRTLASMGFAILEPGNMPFTAQIAAFNDAAVIVGGHGSTFGNLIAARPGATVVDLMPESWIGFWDKPEAERWVLHMTTLFGLDYLPILCCSELIDRNESDDATARRAKGMHYEVDLNLLKRVVGRAQDQDYQARDG